MLSPTSLRYAKEIAGRLATSNKSLSVAGESMLNSVVTATMADYTQYSGSNQRDHLSDSNGIVESLESASNEADALGHYEHDTRIEDEAAKLATQASVIFSIARKKLIPICLEASQEYEELANSIETLTTSSYEIEALSNPFFESQQMREMVARYAESAIAAPERVYMNISFNADNVTEIVASNVPAIDTLITSNMSSEYMAETLNNLLIPPTGNGLNNLSTSRRAINELIVVHLAARHMLENIPTGLNITLEDYRRYWSDVIAYTGRVLYRAYERLDAERRRGVLVLIVDKIPSGSTFKLVVDDLIWKQAQNQGIDTETLFGYAMNASPGESQATLGQLLARKHELRRHFMHQQAADRRDLMESSGANKMETLKNIIVSKGLSLLAPDHVEDGKQRLREATLTLRNSDLDEPFLAIRRCLSECIYPGVGVEEAMRIYDEVAEELKTQDSTEISTVAMVYFVTDQLCRQVKVEDTAMDTSAL